MAARDGSYAKADRQMSAWWQRGAVEAQLEADTLSQALSLQQVDVSQQQNTLLVAETGHQGLATNIAQKPTAILDRHDHIDAFEVI